MQRSVPPFYFIGNHIILDYINTRVPIDGKLTDFLATFPNLLDWLRLSNLLELELVDRFEQKWDQVKHAERVLAAAIELRDELFNSIQLRQAGGLMTDRCVELINSLLEEQRITTRLIAHGGQYMSQKIVHIDEPDQLLAPIAEAAIDFFSHYSPEHIKRCSNPECVLYFYDNSKNSTRRWCSQKTCGNRMKVRAYLERQRRHNKSK